MFGLSFLNSIFWAGLLAATLPILIHLFSRRRAREVPFPSLEYLHEISRQRIRRMRLRQWLLLMMRVLIVALFALAMMRPAVRGTGTRVARGSSTVALVLDNSYSMDAVDPKLAAAPPREAAAESDRSDRSDRSEHPAGGRAPAGGRTEGQAGGPAGGDLGERAGGSSGTSPVDEEGTVFHSAKERAQEILDLMGEGDRGLLVLCGRPVSMPFQTPVADAGLIRQEIRRATLVGDASDLPAALEQVLPVLESAHTLNKEIFIISDFQRSDLDQWARATSAQSAPGARAPGTVRDSSGALQSIRIPAGIHVYLVPVREGASPNASLERMRFEAASGAARAGKLTVVVVNQGEEPVTDRVVRALSAGPDETPLADGTISLPPHGRGEVNLDLPQLPPDGAIEVRLGSDALEWDNRGYLVTGESGAPRVLLVAGDDTPYLRAALDPEGNSEFFRLRQVPPDGLTDPSVWDNDVIILSNVGRLDDAAADNLARFRAHGGGILIGLGDQVDPRYYNTQILSRISSISLLNVSQEEGNGAYRPLRPSVASHPIFSGFPIGPGEDLGSARFHKMMTCRTGPSARVVAEFGKDAPALIEDERVLLFASSFDGQWNDFVTSASFPPLLHQMVHYLARRGDAGEDIGRVGSRLETLLPEGTAASPVTCRDPLGGQSRVEEIPAGQMTRLRSQPALWPGIYRFVDATGKTAASFAVNLDPKEGNLATATPQLEARLFGRDAQRLDPGKAITRTLLQGRYGRELWRPLLVMVLILLAAESILGRGKLLG